MDEPRKLARILVAVAALYVLILFGMNIIQGLMVFTVQGYANQVFKWTPLVYFVILIALFALIGYLFLYRREFWAKLITGTESQPEVGQTGETSQRDWLRFAFRLSCVIAGLLFVFRICYAIITILQKYVVFQLKSRPFNISSTYIITWIVLTAIAVYLLCGAPHFVRWHVRKTFEQCKKSNGGER